MTTIKVYREKHADPDGKRYIGNTAEGNVGD